MSVRELIARQSVDVLLPHLPQKGGRVLELGCGDGAVAAELERGGYRVLALDPDADAVERARDRGVEARVASWPEGVPDEAGFHAVVCVRSLHHMERLDASVARAREVLRSGGTLLAVEFDRTPLDPVAAAWVRSTTRILDAALGLETDEESFERRLVAGDDPAVAWAELHHHYDQEFPTLVEMRRALKRAMGSLREETCATLYRYPARALPDVDAATAVARRLLAAERELLDTGRVELPGRLLVARRD